MLELEHLFKSELIYSAGTFSCLDKTDTDNPSALVYCEDIHHLKKASKNANVSAIITSSHLLSLLDYEVEKGVIVSDHPKYEYWKLFNKLVNDNFFTINMEFGMGTSCNIHPSSVISPKSLIGDNVSIGANAVIEDNSIVGDGSVIGPGVVVGAEGMQFIEKGTSRMFIKHAGGIRIGNDVVILSNSIAQKAVLPAFTEIGNGCRLSVLVSIGHQSKVGENCSFAGNVLVGGSVEFGENVVVGPSATIKDGLTIGPDAQILIGSVVVKDVKEGEIVSGNFAIPHTKNLRDYARKLK